jgi:hypothetical protein
MKMNKLQLFYLILILVYSYLLIFCETYGFKQSKKEQSISAILGILLLVFSLGIFLFKFNKFPKMELLFSWALVALLLIGSPLMHSPHQINTMFGIIGINFIFANKDLNLFTVLSRFTVFVGYIFAGLNKLVSYAFMNGSILEPYFKERLPWAISTPRVLSIITFAIPIIEILLAFAVIANHKFTWLGICVIHLGMAFILAHGPAHAVELCIFGALMLFGVVSGVQRSRIQT